VSYRTEQLAEGVTLILGDCLEVLPTLVGVDAVISDVPYGIGWDRGEGGSAVRGTKSPAVRLSSKPIAGDDRPFDPTPILAFPEVILFGANHYCHRLPVGKWHAWDKLHGWASHDRNSDVEFIWQKGRPGASRIISHLWKGVQQDSEKGLSKVHQSQKPVAVMEWCIGLVPNAKHILDPYMGSGSTGVAAVRLGRRFTGVEIDDGHFATACRRIEAALSQPDIFIDPPAPLKQTSMFEGAA
jgi:site-specific DNA-methyltransferase (adenine-specific)